MTPRIVLVGAALLGAAAMSGGIALAASGGAPDQPGTSLPTATSSGLASTADDATTGIPADAGRTGATDATDDPSDTPTDETTDETTDAPDPTDTSDSSSAQTPTPSLFGLCHAWLAGAGSKHGHARSNPAFTVLVTTAGGADSVDGYCTTLLASGAPTPSDQSTATDTSAAAPAGAAPVQHPTGRPSSVPPVSHPDGPPSWASSHGGGRP